MAQFVLLAVSDLQTVAAAAVPADMIERDAVALVEEAEDQAFDDVLNGLLVRYVPVIKNNS